MKRIVIIAIVILSCAIMAGCGKITGCKTSHWPEPGVSINWDGCNDVKTMIDYFNCHDSVLHNNYVDEIKVRGYIKDTYSYGLVICADTILKQDNFIPIFPWEGAPAPVFDTTRISTVTGIIAPMHHDVNQCCDIIVSLSFREIE